MILLLLRLKSWILALRIKLNLMIMLRQILALLLISVI
nr:MAG TPA: hypothetical protein [Caudoviricetes sp.]